MPAKVLHTPRPRLSLSSSTLLWLPRLLWYRYKSANCCQSKYLGHRGGAARLLVRAKAPATAPFLCQRSVQTLPALHAALETTQDLNCAQYEE